MSVGIKKAQDEDPDPEVISTELVFRTIELDEIP